MIKNKISVILGGVGIVALLAAGVASAQVATSTTPTPLAATCAGSVSTNVVTWSATTTGGTAPYSFAWSGGTGVSGTSSSAVATYAATGTVSASVLVHDSASSTVTATCSASVLSLPIVVVPPPVPTPIPVSVPPMLQINPSGEFLARGLTVTSVASGSFQGIIWGVTYTVNLPANAAANLEFFFRKAGGNFNASQLKVGDVLGVQGRVDASAPMTVKARVIRDYSIIQARPKDNDGEGHGNGKNENEHGFPGISASGTVSTTANIELRGKLDGLLKMLKDLQNRTGGHGGENGGYGGN